MFWRILIKNIGKYILNILIAIDQLINAILLGDPDETLSSRAGKSNWIWAKVINKLFFWQDNHSKNAIEYDEWKDKIK